MSVAGKAGTGNIVRTDTGRDDVTLLTTVVTRAFLSMITCQMPTRRATRHETRKGIERHRKSRITTDATRVSSAGGGGAYFKSDPIKKLK